MTHVQGDAPNEKHTVLLQAGRLRTKRKKISFRKLEMLWKHLATAKNKIIMTKTFFADKITGFLLKA
jgi:hypothetical protein